ncbi:peptide-methionine (S)-S-oxide reductase [Paenibacillus taihuensis]|uniref:Peptide methionine sulfoxide reductase MsrA n=1 Tax=Paenibacillus taihuensis TaxID=1156355 RepID=A0A3D9R355_9BACL|nr:peptide-methionine (S)-S-oxide reductase MsrA [Paenibacillus taihuensis]REE69710.1 peptide-methionine (S)-S-oxide reductase [Paenibacillus taihuensis]
MTAMKNGNMKEPLETAIFAGGCFWHMEDAFQKLDGVSHVYAGYTGGVMENPTYEQVVSYMSDHIEAVEVHYNPNAITYHELLNNFWKNSDLRESAIFYTSNEQRELAQKSLNEMAKQSIKPVVTKIAAASTFYMAEEEHQNYYKKNGLAACLNKVWGLRK